MIALRKIPSFYVKYAALQDSVLRQPLQEQMRKFFFYFHKPELVLFSGVDMIAELNVMLAHGKHNKHEDGVCRQWPLGFA